MADVTLPDAVMRKLVKEFRALHAAWEPKAQAYRDATHGTIEEEIALGQMFKAEGRMNGFDKCLHLLGLRAAVAARAAQEVDDGA